MNTMDKTRSPHSETTKNQTRIFFELATKDDDPALRRLLRNIRMDGLISVSFGREPNYFAAHQCEGQFVQVLIARDRNSDQIVGMGTRSIRDRYVAGNPRKVGYLSGLRIHPDYRGNTVLARGYRFLKELDQDAQAEFYVTTIAVENRAASNSLLGGRAGLPFYNKIGRLNTWIIPKKHRSKRSAQAQIRAIQPPDIPALMSFLEKVSKQRELLPNYQERDFLFPSDVFTGMKSGHLHGMWIDGQLLGTLGLWDQRSIKQVVVEQYDWRFRFLRPLYNAFANAMRKVRFPPPGQCLPLITAALPLAIGKGVDFFGVLVDHVASSIPTDADAMMIGVSDRDPLSNSIRCRAIQNYQTDIFTVSWNEDLLKTALPMESIPYLELGAL
jgi:hypothetical protein